ncbi:hypothetical protein AAC387_Pa09g1922 [Persea americana]
MEEGKEEPMLSSAFPLGRVRKIVKLDKEIDRVNSEALFLISLSTDLFLHFLTDKSMQVALDKKRRTIKTDHIRIAAKRHRPTADFLLDSLPMPSQPPARPSSDQTKPSSSHVEEKPLPPGVRRIDHFFHKSAEVEPSLNLAGPKTKGFVERNNILQLSATATL